MRTEDGHIIHKCLGGDTAAFGLLVDKYRASVYALAYSKLGNFHDAEDVTQEVFLKAYQKLRTLKQWDRFLSWLYAITSNLCKDFSRSRSNRPDTEYVADQNKEHLEKLSVDSYHETEVYQSLHETLAMLPEIHRQVLTLHYLGGMRHREIAQFLGTSPHAIAMRLNRARSKLKTEMLTLMKTRFDQQKLQPAFTLNIVEIIKQTRIQPNPRIPTIPVGIATVSLLTLLCLTAPFNPFQVIGSLVGAPLARETKITKVGEIPTEVVVLAETSILSSGDSKKALAGNPQPADGIQVANGHTETETAGQNEPYTRLGNGTVHTLAYSPDGSLIAVAGKSTWLYDANTLAEVGRIERSARTIAFSPDGRTLASGSWPNPDRTVHLWDVATQERVGGLQLPGLRGVTAVAFTSDGNILAVGYGNGDIALWDMKTQRQIAQQTVVRRILTSIPWTLAFSPDGQLLAAGGHEAPAISLWAGHEAFIISLWDVPTLELVGSLEEQPGDTWSQNHAVSSIAFSSDGAILASSSHYDYTVRLWDVTTQRQIALLLENDGSEGDGAVNAVAFSPDGTILASGGDDAKIRLWDVKTQTQIDVLDTNAGTVSSMAFRPDGKTLASLSGLEQHRRTWQKSGDMSVRLWDVKTRKQIAMLQNHTADIKAVTLSPDDALLASGHRDGVVTLWDMQTQESLTILRNHTAAVLSVAFSPDGTLLASGEKEKTRLWDVQTKEEIAIFTMPHTIVESVAFSPDGKILALLDDSCIRLWDMQQKSHIRVLGQEPSHEGPAQPHSTIRSMAFSPDGKLLASGGTDNTLRLWDVQKRQENFIQKTHSSIFALAFSPDGKTLAWGGDHEEIYLWNVEKWGLVTTLNIQGRIETLAFSPDGRLLAACNGGSTCVWDLKTQAKIGPFYGPANSLTFSHDGEKLIMGGTDGIIIRNTDMFEEN